MQPTYLTDNFLKLILTEVPAFIIAKAVGQDGLRWFTSSQSPNYVFRKEIPGLEPTNP